MSKKNYWLDRTLVTSPYFLTLCTTEKQFKGVLKHLKLPKKVWPDFVGSAQSNATVHFFDNTKEQTQAAVVCLRARKGVTPAQILSILVHEAVHVWQACKESYGEKTPSEEFEAYSIQAITQALLVEYERQCS